MKGKFFNLGGGVIQRKFLFSKFRVQKVKGGVIQWGVLYNGKYGIFIGECKVLRR